MFLALAILISFLLTNCRMLQKTENKSASEKPDNRPAAGKAPMEIHRQAIVIDMHADTTQRLLDESLNMAVRDSAGHLDSVGRANCQPDQRRSEQADVLSAWEHESPERTDDQSSECKPEERERETDQRPREQQHEDDDQQDDDDRHATDGSERDRQVLLEAEGVFTSHAPNSGTHSRRADMRSLWL